MIARPIPNVPTIAEAGMPGVGVGKWQGLFAPLAVPRAQTYKLV